MSLPNRAIFYKNGEVVMQSFVNCGWILTRKTVIQAVERAIASQAERFDWDQVVAYDLTITREEVLPLD